MGIRGKNNNGIDGLEDKAEEIAEDKGGGKKPTLGLPSNKSVPQNIPSKLQSRF